MRNLYAIELYAKKFDIVVSYGRRINDEKAGELRKLLRSYHGLEASC